ncbi:MAG TPA: hypothetical protein VJG90_03505 [Candidatus Nanoarchaeia archaeon]|nr:hypothetical protein [Candidatus Nanoarchaeia archaeon]
MSFLKLLGITSLILVILAGVLTSLFALNLTQPTRLFSMQTLQNPIQAFLLFLGVLILVLLIIFLSIDRSAEEAEEPILEQLHPEHLHPDYPFLETEDMDGISLTYPAMNLQNEQHYTIETVNERILSPKNEPEFKRFLKNAILELEREKARIYHEVALLDEDYHKGIITEKEFLMGVQLILREQGLDELIEEKDLQIEDYKTKLAEMGITKKPPSN